MIKLGAHSYTLEEVKSSLESKGFTIVERDEVQIRFHPTHTGFFEERENIKMIHAVLPGEALGENTKLIRVAQRIYDSNAHAQKMAMLM